MWPSCMDASPCGSELRLIEEKEGFELNGYLPNSKGSGHQCVPVACCFLAIERQRSATRPTEVDVFPVDWLLKARSSGPITAWSGGNRRILLGNQLTGP